MQYRHGDVLLGKPVQIPAGARKLNTDIVAEGEVTGHAHRIVEGDVYELDGSLLVSGKAMVHEEHAPLSLAPIADGWAYPVTIQREYDDEKEWRQVAD